MRNEVQRSCSFTPLWCLGTIVSPSIAQMSLNFSQVCTTTCQMVLAHMHFQIGSKILKITWKNSNLGFQYLWSIYQNAFYKQERDIVGRCYTTIMWPQNTICNFVKVHGLIRKTLVNRSLTKSSKIHKKFKTYQNLLKSSPMESLCQIMSMKNDKLE